LPEARMKMTVVERLRSLFQEPFAEVKRMGIAEGMKVADLGAGEGYFTMPAAIVVGKAGVVIAVEPDLKRSDLIKARATREGLDNVRVIVTKAEDLSGVPSGEVDLAFSAFTMHHFEDRGAALKEIRRVLRDGGTFYLWDRVPGRFFKWGTQPKELEEIAAGFAKFEPIEVKGTVRARFVK